MKHYALEVVRQAQAWLGCNESDGSHKGIIDVYNAHKPLARGYAVKYTDAWCAAFVSAVAVKLGYTDIIPTECGCDKMIALFKGLGAWVEDDAYIPKPGDIIFYDWNDSGSGDNTGSADHVGIVETVSGPTVTVIEGNYSNSVKRRILQVNGKYIRGYGVPRYNPEAAEKTGEGECKVNVQQVSKGSKGAAVKAMQLLVIGYGYSCGWDGADGVFGTNTLAAVKRYQKDKGLTVDGIVGPQTWTSLLGL